MERHPKDFKYNNDKSIGESVAYDICKGCKFRNDDIVVDGSVLYEGFSAGACKKYPDGKPNKYAAPGAKCPYKV